MVEGKTRVKKLRMDGRKESSKCVHQQIEIKLLDGQGGTSFDVKALALTILALTILVLLINAYPRRIQAYVPACYL